MDYSTMVQLTVVERKNSPKIQKKKGIRRKTQMTRGKRGFISFSTEKKTLDGRLG